MALPIQTTLPVRKHEPADVEKKLKDAASMYEQHFLQEMMKGMRKTVTQGTPLSQGEKLYREQLDQKYVEAWSSNGGIGLSKVIYDQLHAKFFPDRTAPAPKGPLPAETSRVHSVKDGDARMDFSFEGTGDVTAPFDGKILSAQALPSGETGVLISHPELNMESRLVFNGSANIKPGQNIAAGEVLASNSSGKTYWSVVAS